MGTLLSLHDRLSFYTRPKLNFYIACQIICVRTQPNVSVILSQAVTHSIVKFLPYFVIHLKHFYILLFLGFRRQQLRLRAARTVPVALRARGPEHGLVSAVGDRGLQAASALTQRRSVQEDIRHLHRIQRDRLEDRQRAKVIT